MYPFGSDFKYTFTAIVDEEEVALPTQTPAIYVYNSRPSRTAARAGSGSPLQTITTWTETSAYVRTISVSSIEDPDPTSEGVTGTEFWIAINFRLQASAQIQTNLRRLEMVRPDAAHKRLVVRVEDLEGVYSEVDTYATPETLTGHIEAALLAIKAKLKSKGYEWATLFRPDFLKLAAIYKALHLFGVTQRGDEMRDRTQLWGREYEALITSLVLELDTDKDGSPDTTEKAPSYWIVGK